jgi:hypothetical protein
MNQLHQIQLRFDPAQDRLILRVNTSGGDEFRFWLTRRLVRLLWPALIKALEADDLVRSQPDPAARQAVLAFQQDTAVSQSDFRSSFREEPASMPLGEAPVLVSRVQLAPGPSGSRVLRLSPARGPGAQIGLNQTALHAFCRLTLQAVEKAQWDLGLKLAETGATSPPERMN